MKGTEDEERPNERLPAHHADQLADDPDDAVAIAFSLAQPVEVRLRGLRNYSRLQGELRRQGPALAERED